MSRGRLTQTTLVLAAFAAGCHATGTASPGDAGTPAGAGGTGVAGSAAASDAGAAGTAGTIDTADAGPVAWIDATVGSYGLGPELAINASSDPTPRICNAITGVVRDFKGALPAYGGMTQAGGHPDFEVFEGQSVTPHLVADTLDTSDMHRRPLYASKCQLGAPVSTDCPNGAMTTTKANFDQWYQSIAGVNIPFLVYFKLGEPDPVTGVSTFDSSSFFPLDGAGWGNSGTDESKPPVPHNFSFTTEIHTTFKYRGGETFKFKGDDDVWIFINGTLAVDLGGLHTSAEGSVDLDVSASTLGITKGVVYPLDLFHAERHGVNSDFQIAYNFTFESCGYVVP